MAVSARKRRIIGYTLTLSIIASLLALYFIYGAEQLRRRACWQQIVAKVNTGSDLVAGIDLEIERFQGLVEESLTARSIMLSLLNDLGQRREGPLTGRDLVRLKAGTDGYLKLRSRLYDTAREYECAAEVSDRFVAAHSVDPHVRLKAVMMSLAAALVLNDNYILAISLFEHDDRLRRLLNAPDSGFEIGPNSLREIRRAASSPVIRYRIRRVLQFYDKKREALNVADRMLSDSRLAYLDELIQSSPSYRYIGEIRGGAVVKAGLLLLGDVAEDFIGDISREGIDTLSMMFGNTVGLYEARKGKLFGDEAVFADVSALLRPLDILLEKTPFRLTDKFIPGHFGHVAIWLGTEDELRELGVWDHPVVARFHDELRGNDRGAKRVVEALRSGVQLSSLRHFLNVDDLAVLRPAALWSHPDANEREQTLAEAVTLALRQVGKDYDFNFDVNTTDRIVCSELVYAAFPTIQWETDATLGRDTISPDRVVQKAFDGSPLSLLLFYHDGRRVSKGGSGNSDLALVRRLMGQDVVPVR